MQIIQWPHPFLSEVCNEVDNFNSELHQILDDMLKVLKATKGIGLAANQVSVLFRIFIMTPKLEDGSLGDVIEFINPEIIEASSEKAGLNEGCLSAPNIYAPVQERSEQVTVRAKDRNGNEFTQTFTGINAVCVQHEIDHLDGIFFFSKLNRQNRRQAQRAWESERRKS